MLLKDPFTNGIIQKVKKKKISQQLMLERKI